MYVLGCMYEYVCTYAYEHSVLVVASVAGTQVPSTGYSLVPKCHSYEYLRQATHFRHTSKFRRYRPPTQLHTGRGIVVRLIQFESGLTKKEKEKDRKKDSLSSTRTRALSRQTGQFAHLDSLAHSPRSAGGFSWCNSRRIATRNRAPLCEYR
jgi:hypothetical protein